jgi:hypothetical protein
MPPYYKADMGILWGKREKVIFLGEKPPEETPGKPGKSPSLQPHRLFLKH